MAALIHAKILKGKKLWYLWGATGNRKWIKEYPQVQSRSGLYAELRKEFSLPAATDNTDIVFLLFNKTWNGKEWVDDFMLQLRYFREKKGWTQAQLAEKSNLSVQAIAALEQGTRGPTWETVLKLAHAMELNVEDFRVDAKAMKRTETAS